jgi:hypothetical protein
MTDYLSGWNVGVDPEQTEILPDGSVLQEVTLVLVDEEPHAKDDSGGSVARLGMSERVARSRELVVSGYAVAAVARVLQVTRQAIYRVPRPRRGTRRIPAGTGRRHRAGDRARRRGEPDRRLPDRHRVGSAQAGAGGEPQAGAAGAAGDARAQADPAPVCQ